jgi:3-oxoadipate enol-lactonase
MSSVALHHLSNAGQGASTLVLSNSLGTTIGVWDAQSEPLAAGRRLIRYDHRGHGSSPVPRGPYSLDDIAGDVIGLLDSLGVQRTSFCGSSLGGMVGIWLAAHAPERIDRLVVCCSSAYIPPSSSWSERAAAVRAAGSVEAVADAVLGRWLTPAFAAERPEVVAKLRGMLVGTPAEGYAACCEAIGAMDLRPVLARIAAPTLVVSAARDPATPTEAHGRVIAEGIPGAKLAVLHDAAHMAAVEQPDQITELILGHLD